MFIEVQFLLTFRIDRIIIHELPILETAICIESTKIDTQEYK